MLSAQLHRKRFGTKSQDKILENIVKLSDISGLGKFKIVNSTFPIKMKINSSFEEFKEFKDKLSVEYKYFKNHLFELIVGGIEEIYEIKTKFKIQNNIITLEIKKTKEENSKKIKTLNLKNIEL